MKNKQQEWTDLVRKRYVGKRVKMTPKPKWIKTLLYILMAVFVMANGVLYLKIVFGAGEIKALGNDSRVSEEEIITPEETPPETTKTVEVTLERKMSGMESGTAETISERMREKKEEIKYLQATLVMNQANPNTNEEDGDAVPPEGEDFAEADESNLEVWQEESHEDDAEQEAEPCSWTATFKVTAYCSCQKCCPGFGKTTSTGAIPTQGRTIAVDPTVIPYGSIVIMDGHEYIAEDCGGAIKANRLDVYFDSHQEALEFGVREYECTVIPSTSLN